MEQAQAVAGGSSSNSANARGLRAILRPRRPMGLHGETSREPARAHSVSDPSDELTISEPLQDCAPSSPSALRPALPANRLPEPGDAPGAR